MVHVKSHATADEEQYPSMADVKQQKHGLSRLQRACGPLSQGEACPKATLSETLVLSCQLFGCISTQRLNTMQKHEHRGKSPWTASSWSERALNPQGYGSSGIWREGGRLGGTGVSVKSVSVTEQGWNSSRQKLLSTHYTHPTYYTNSKF